MFPSSFFERLMYKLSDEGFHDIWNIGGFVVLFGFTTLTLTLMLGMFIWWCQERAQMNTVGVMPVPPIKEPEEPERIEVAAQTSRPEAAVEVVLLVPEFTTDKKQPNKLQQQKWKWFRSKKPSDVLPV